MNANSRLNRPSRVPIRKMAIVNNAKRQAFNNIGNLQRAAPTRGNKAADQLKPKNDQQTLVFQNNQAVVQLLYVPLAVDSPEPMEVEENVKALPEDVTDIDGGDPDPLLCKEYALDVFKYLKNLEVSFQIREDFMSQQYEISYTQRAILIDWLNQVHKRFHLCPETLYLTVSITDAYLQVKEVPRKMFQLLGVTALFIAAKYEETMFPDVKEFVYITENSCKMEDILKMEMRVLKALNFRIGRPLHITFLRRYTQAGDSDALAHNLAKFFLELSLQYHKMASLPPSLQAAAASNLSSRILDEKFNWNCDLQYYSGYSASDVASSTNMLVDVVSKSENSKLQAVRKKYASSMFYKVSSLPELSSLFSLRF